VQHTQLQSRAALCVDAQPLTGHLWPMQCVRQHQLLAWQLVPPKSKPALLLLVFVAVDPAVLAICLLTLAVMTRAVVAGPCRNSMYDVFPGTHFAFGIICCLSDNANWHRCAP
jgi:hypothetical protein